MDITVMFEGKRVNAFDILALKNIPYRYYLALFSTILTVQEAFDLLCSLYEKEPWIFTSKDSAMSEIKKHYSSISQFCLVHKIKYDLFRRLISRNSHISLFNIFLLYLKEPYNIYEKYQNIYAGVSVEAICVYFQINSNTFYKLQEKYHSLPVILKMCLLYSYPKKFHSRLKEEAGSLWNLPYENIENLSYEEPFLECTKDYAKRCFMLDDALNAYYIVDFFENHWQEFFKEEISYLHRKREATFFKDYEKLKMLAQKKLLERFSITREELNECYQMLDENYVKATFSGQDVWVYKKKKIVSLS